MSIKYCQLSLIALIVIALLGYVFVRDLSSANRNKCMLFLQNGCANGESIKQIIVVVRIWAQLSISTTYKQRHKATSLDVLSHVVVYPVCSHKPQPKDDTEYLLIVRLVISFFFVEKIMRCSGKTFSQKDIVCYDIRLQSMILSFCKLFAATQLTDYPMSPIPLVHYWLWLWL